MNEQFDDAPQWYWAVSNSPRSASPANAGEAFVIACGQKELWTRVRADVDSDKHCAWAKFGPRDGSATLDDCLLVMLRAREHFGASFNRLMLELARVPAFARFIHEARMPLANLISSPLCDRSLVREPYDVYVEQQLGRIVEQTLDLPDDSWREP